MNTSPRNSQKSGLVTYLGFVALLIALWLLAPAQVTAADFAAVSVYDQGSSMLVGALGILFLLRRRRRVGA